MNNKDEEIKREVKIEILTDKPIPNIIKKHEGWTWSKGTNQILDLAIQKTRQQEQKKIIEIYKDFQREMLKNKINVKIVFDIGKLIKEKYNINILKDDLTYNERLKKARKEFEK